MVNLKNIKGTEGMEMTRSITYRTKTLEELINCYAHEVGRDNQKDKETTQRMIVNEVYARIKDTFDMLNADPEAADQIYRQLLEH